MTPIHRRLPVAALETRSEWQILTPKQRGFVQVYIQGGYDAPAAVRAAYGTAVEKNAVIFSYELLANPKINSLLTLHFGWTEQEKLEARRIRRRKSVRSLIRLVRFQLKNAEPGSSAAQRLTSQLQSLLLDEALPKEIANPEPKVEAATKSQEPQVPTMRAEVAPSGRVAIADAGPKPEPVFRVGDHAWDKSVEYIVTAVDGAGAITAAEPVEK